MNESKQPKFIGEFVARSFPIWSCAFCGFEGVMSSTAKCWEDGATMVLCPKCRVVVCVNSEEIAVKDKRKVVKFCKWRESDDVPRMVAILAKGYP